MKIDFDKSFSISNNKYDGVFCEATHVSKYCFDVALGEDPIEKLTFKLNAYEYENGSNVGNEIELGYAKLRIVPSHLKNNHYLQKNFPEYNMYNDMVLYDSSISHVAEDMELDKLQGSVYKKALEQSDLYYIEEIVIHNNFRSIGLGAFFINAIEQSIEQVFKETPILACMAFPFEYFEENDVSEEELVKETNNLCQFYEKSGFKTIKTNNNDRGILSCSVLCVKNPY